MKKIYLLKGWNGLRRGDGIRVLQPLEEIEGRCVDPVRAQTLLDIKVASRKRPAAPKAKKAVTSG